MRISMLGVVAIAGCATASQNPPVTAPAPSGVTAVAASSTADLPTGDRHDFDEFAGGWNFTNKRLKARNVGSTEWDEFPSVSCTSLYIDGISNVDEIYFPTKGWSGLTVRAFDVAKRQWSIWWINSREGVMYPPVVGGFTGNDGNFYGDDKDGDKPVKVRFHWIKYSRDHLLWEQYFSYDGGKTWEMNWTNELTRGDEAALCDHGRPRRQPEAT